MRKYSLKELEHLLPVLDENEQKAIMGGGNGTYNNPFTQMEYLNLVAENHWSGGYVDGLGLVDRYTNVSYNSSGSSYSWSGSYYDSGYYGMLPEVTVVANMTTTNSYCESFRRYSPFEGIGLNATFQVQAATSISNGWFHVSSAILGTGAFDSWTQQAIVYVNDNEVGRYRLEPRGDYFYPTGWKMMGETLIDLRNLHGKVEIKLYTVGSKHDGAGNTKTGGEMVVYSQYR